MTGTQKLTNFVKELKARLSQDANQVVVYKNQRKADSALNSQISALENKLVDEETALEDAIEALSTSKYPITIITDGQQYVRNVANAKAHVDKCQAQLDGTKLSIEFFKTLRAENNAEVAE